MFANFYIFPICSRLLAMAFFFSLTVLSGCSSSNPGVNSPAPDNAIALSDGTYARITSLNGTFDPAHSATVSVHPGDVVSLSPDVIAVSGGKYTAQNEAVESFAWSSDLNDTDRCDASQDENCIEKSNFEATDYGVNYYVPYSIDHAITVTLSDVNHPEWHDTVVLQNVETVPVTAIVTDAADYPYPKLDATLALAGHGRWVVVGDVRRFVPYATSEDWAPYQNGSWAWVEGTGWTWTSNDPWGWYTDHYGVWRHHESYGWVWNEFTDHHYDAAPVTWVYNDTQIGWYPYADAYRASYALGADYGFDDGFETGLNYGDHYDSAHMHAGFCFVGYGNLSADNVFDVRLTDSTEIDRIYLESYHAHGFGAYPGANNPTASLHFVEGHNVVIPHTTVRVSTIGGRPLSFPVRVHPMPASAIDPRGRDDERLTRPISIGSIITAVDNAGHAQVIPPTGNGKGIGVPPRRLNGDGSHSAPLPPRTSNPATANPNLPTRLPAHNPVMPMPKPTMAPAPRPTVQPAPRPTVQPAPRPTVQPAPRPTVQPAPRPTVQPAPRPTVQPAPRPTVQPAPRPTPTHHH